MSPSRPATILRSGWFWLALYAVTTAILVVVLLQTRATILANMSTPEAKAEWDEWRAAAANQSTGGPVKRQPPKSSEPPSLVLMRDHFAVVLAGAIFFGSMLFATFAITVRGVMAPKTAQGTRRTFERDL